MQDRDVALACDPGPAVESERRDWAAATTLYSEAHQGKSEVEAREKLVRLGQPGPRQTATVPP